MFPPFKLYFLWIICFIEALDALMRLSISVTRWGSWSETRLRSALCFRYLFWFRAWQGVNNNRALSLILPQQTHQPLAPKISDLEQHSATCFAILGLSLISFSLCFSLRRVKGSRMSRVLDETAEQDANASRRKAAGWVNAPHLTGSSMFQVQTLWKKPNGFVHIWMLQVPSCKCGSDQRLPWFVFNAGYIQAWNDRCEKDLLTDYW